MRKFGLVGIASLALLLGTAATSGAATRSSSPSESGLAGARAEIATYTQAPKPINIPELTKKPPKDKLIYYVGCNQTNCAQFAAGIGPILKVLGWNFKFSSGAITPASFDSQVTSALAAHPSGLLLTADEPTPSIQSAFNKIKAAGIPYVVVGGGDSKDTTPNPALGGKLFLQTDFGPIPLDRDNKALAAWIAVDSNSKANVVYFNDPTVYTVYQPQTAFDKAFAQYCKGCSLAHQQISIADIGTSIPGQVVAYVQSHPSVNYVMMPFGGSTLGLASALKAAGLSSKVKVVVPLATPPDVTAIQNGQESASTVQDNVDSAYFAADAFARYFTGEKPCSVCANPLVPALIIDKQTIASHAFNTNPNVQFSSPNVKATFEKIWKLKQ
jgi:ABC-type sugar transport system substrate-binding protein